MYRRAYRFTGWMVARGTLASLLLMAGSSCALNFSKDPVDPPDTSTDPDVDTTDSHMDLDTDDEDSDDLDVVPDDVDELDLQDSTDDDVAIDPISEDPPLDDTAVDDTPADDALTNPYTPLDYQDLDLRASIEAIPIPDLSSLPTNPNSTRRAQWSTFLSHVLSRNWTNVYAWGISTMGLSIVVVHDVGGAGSTGRDYLLIWDAVSGEGIYVLDPDATRPLVLEVPYPAVTDDPGTLVQGIETLRDTQGWALLIAGTTRCSRTDLLICDGTTLACDAVPSAFRLSNVAHNPNLIFELVHRTLMDFDTSALAVQLQGQTDASGAIAILSDGTLFDATGVPPGISVMLRDALRTVFPAWSGSIRSCNAPADSGLYSSECQTTNVQGRYTNGSSNLCADEAPGSAQRFVVLEQDPLLLDEARLPLFATAVIALF